MSTVRDDLIAAAVYIERRGHCKGNYFDGDRVCALGALMETTAGSEAFGKAKEALRGQIGGQPIPAWNDAEARTQAEVVATLRAAAEAVTS